MDGYGNGEVNEIWVNMMNCTLKEIRVYQLLFVLKDVKAEPQNVTLENGNELKFKQ